MIEQPEVTGDPIPYPLHEITEPDFCAARDEDDDCPQTWETTHFHKCDRPIGHVDRDGQPDRCRCRCGATL